jgi:hypothetical protein
MEIELGTIMLKNTKNINKTATPSKNGHCWDRGIFGGPLLSSIF